MSLISVVMLCIMCYCLGLQKGKNPAFFKELFRKPPELQKAKPKKKNPTLATKKVVSIHDYKRQRK